MEFRGVVVILFDQPNGSPIEIENGKQIYRIPFSGALRTQAKPSYLIKRHEYYFVDINGNRSNIHYLPPSSAEGIGDKNKLDLKQTDIFIYGEEMGSTPVNQPRYTVFRTFIVSELAQYNEMLRSKNRIIEEILSEGRQ